MFFAVTMLATFDRVAQTAYVIGAAPWTRATRPAAVQVASGGCNSDTFVGADPAMRRHNL